MSHDQNVALTETEAELIARAYAEAALRRAPEIEFDRQAEEKRQRREAELGAQFAQSFFASLTAMGQPRRYPYGVDWTTMPAPSRWYF